MQSAVERLGSPRTLRAASRGTVAPYEPRVASSEPRTSPHAIIRPVSTTAPALAADSAPAADVRTIADLPFHVMGRFPKSMLLGRCRQGGVDGISSQEFFERVRDLSLGLGALGIGPGDRVVIMGESRTEWLMADLAILAAGGVTVPIYPTLSAPQARYILQDSGAKAAIVSTRPQLDKIQEVRHELNAIEAVVLIDGWVESDSPSVMSIDGLAERGHRRMTAEWGAGKAFQDGARRIAPDSLATIIYTSGTTGEPKGVMLTHANLVSNMKAGADVLQLSQEDVALSFLPLSHGFERTVAYIYLYSGVTVAFAESFDTIGRDISTVRPTLLTGVPRVFEKVHARIVEKGRATPGVKGSIFQWAVAAGTARGRAELRGESIGMVSRLQTALADRLVFSKIRENLGNRIRYLVSGSAPLSPAISEFFQGVGLPIIEGYGLTETSPILTVNPPDRPRLGTVGRALPGVELRIAEDGEILARGPNIMAGYLNKAEATATAVVNGWFHTGDIGTIDAEGYLTITDRKKDLLVTSGGKKIAPQPIEGVLKRSPLVGEAVLLGDRRKFAAALIVPDFAALERRLQQLGRPPAASREELIVREDVVALYQEVVDALNRELAQFERIKKIALLPREFSIESGELTPTLKVKRKVVEARWKGEIEAIYADGGKE
jgi:long-chain acyl-CoA synthetase